eukprot:CAMPEP_0180047322 /NCGR_PEP_ID=MMETSP0984-20121128/37689_1 /TAXON_ID=483367 /ORGANISM="non described non described, Strain CCMP 2436" /LENGTH=183 /DNA_ID=CAMNT_0021976137 /DNA_START=37 /DNA_END=586 /DNA_ORIENTATION=-
MLDRRFGSLKAALRTCSKRRARTRGKTGRLCVRADSLGRAGEDEIARQQLVRGGKVRENCRHVEYHVRHARVLPPLTVDGERELDRAEVEVGHEVGDRGCAGERLGHQPRVPGLLELVLQPPPGQVEAKANPAHGLEQPLARQAAEGDMRPDEQHELRLVVELLVRVREQPGRQRAQRARRLE